MKAFGKLLRQTDVRGRFLTSPYQQFLKALSFYVPFHVRRRSLKSAFIWGTNWGTVGLFGKLNARKVATAGPGNYPDGGGLYLCVAPSGARSWVFQFSWHGRRTEMGLGSLLNVSLSEARAAATEARKMVAAGRNPIEARRVSAQAAAMRMTFGQVADELIAAKESEWRNKKHRAQWRASLTEFAAPLATSRLIK